MREVCAWGIGLAIAAHATGMGALGCTSSSGGRSVCNASSNVNWEGCPREGATRVGDAADAAFLVHWFLQTDRAGLAAFVAKQRSDRASGHEAQYLSVSQLRAQFGAAATAVAEVRSYLEQHSLAATLDPSGTFLSTRMTAAQITAILETTMGRYVDGPQEFSAADRAPVLPAALLGSVTAIVGLNNRVSVGAPAPSRPSPQGDAGGGAAGAAGGGGAAASAGSAGAGGTVQQFCVGYNGPALSLDANTNYTGTLSGTATGCASGSKVPSPTGLFTPNQLNAAYGVTTIQNTPTPVTNATTHVTTDFTFKGDGTSGAIVGGQFYVEDFQLFLDCFSDYFDQPIALSYVGDPPAAGSVQPVESIMDVIAMAYAAPHVDTLHYLASGFSAAGIISGLGQVLGLSPLPDVSSGSWGFDDATSLQQAETLIDGHAAVGISWFMASGDNGQTCMSVVEYGPVTSASVTSVGATGLVLNADNSIHQQQPWLYNPPCWQPVCSMSASQSCNLTGLPQPAFQSGAPGVSNYSGQRTTPDIALYGSHVPGAAIYAPASKYDYDSLQTGNPDGLWVGSSGTSFAAPYAAGAALLLAEAKKKTGTTAPLGNLNDYLYAAAKASGGFSANFYDVVAGGNNTWLETPPFTEPQFNTCRWLSDAVENYDLASGLGSVKFDRFVNVVVTPWTQLVTP